MLPFGLAVQRWRLERGMSQAGLAQRAGIPRPNLSNLERGKADASLRTIRALALALNIRPGLLVDGEPPETAHSHFSRAVLERVAQAAVYAQKRLKPTEQAL